jgi:hypothetical protein
MYKLCAKFYHEYCEQVRNWAQENARPDEVIHQLGERMYFRALPIVKSFRSNIYRVNTSETTSSAGSIVRNSWESLYQTIVDAILSHERIEDQHDFVLGLYSVSLNVPTTGGKITDQIVLNRFVYPYLEAALHFYGITRSPVFNATTDGDVEISYLRRIEWVWQDELGNQVRYKHPVDFQKAHSQDSPVLFNIARPNNPQPRTSSLY